MSRRRSLISAMILSVRRSTRRCLTTFSEFILVFPQHKADDDAKRKGGGERGDRTIRDELFQIDFLLIQGLAEVVQGSLDLIGGGLGPAFRGIEEFFPGRAHEA